MGIGRNTAAQSGTTGDRLSPVRSVGRALVVLFSHPWFVVLAGALTLASLVTGIAQGILDFTTIPLVGTLAGVFMLSLSGMAYARRHLTPTLEGRAAAIEDPSAFRARYSDWLLGVKAALPDSDGATTVDYLFIPMSDETREAERAQIAAASRQYRQTYDEEERKARIEYHRIFRAGVLAIVGDRHERAHDPKGIKDLEAVEKLLLAAKPVSPEVAEFKHFAQQFAGWLKSYQPEPFDPAEIWGESYVEEEGMKLVNGEITQRQYENLIRPFTERTEWEQRVRSDYQLNKRADVVRWLSWAKERGAMTGPDVVALITAKQPRTPEEFDEIAGAFERIAERL